MHVRLEGACNVGQGKQQHAQRLQCNARAHDAVGGALLQADLPRSDDKQDNGHEGKRHEHAAIGEYPLIGVGIAAVAGNDKPARAKHRPKMEGRSGMYRLSSFMPVGIG